MLIRLAVVALGLACASASIAAEPPPAPERAEAGFGSEVLIAGWLVVFAAISALYAYERKHRPERALAAVPTGTLRRAATDAPAGRKTLDSGGPAPLAGLRVAEERAAATGQRAIDALLKKKSASAAPGELRPPLVGPTPKLTLPEDSTLLRRPNRPGVTEAGEESFSVAEGEGVTLAGTPSAADAPAAAPLAEASTPDAVGQPSCLERCVALRADGRFAEAARVARTGLVGEDDPGPLLIELSRAELGLGRVGAAIDTARDAHFACRSRESISHLIRLLIETRRFAPDDGPTLRRAAIRHPHQPLLRHAVGVFEAMYGEPCAADDELRAALRLEPDAELRQAIERDLARVSR